jgi:hypothetical protein
VKVVFHGNLGEAHRVRDVLRENGIAAEVKNEILASAVPIDVLWQPEVWIADDSRAAEAEAIVEAIRGGNGEPFTCASCGESVPGSFSACWKCGAERP